MTQLTVCDLRCEDQENLLGIDQLSKSLYIVFFSVCITVKKSGVSANQTFNRLANARFVSLERIF